MSDDADALLLRAEALLGRAGELDAEGRECMRRSAEAGSVAARHGLVRLAVADGDYRRAVEVLAHLRDRDLDAPAERWVSVDPGVLGRGVSLDGDDEEDVVGAGTFTVITSDVQRAAAAVARVAPRLLDVDEHGNVLAPGEMPDGEVYTPSFVLDVEVCFYGAVVKLDTKGVMFSAMGRTIVGMLVDALAADRVPAHITGFCPELESEWRVWQPPQEAG